MSELTMPVAASPGRLDEAIAAFSRAIGPEHVHTDDATLAELSGLTAAGADPDSIGTSRRD